MQQTAIYPAPGPSAAIGAVGPALIAIGRYRAPRQARLIRDDS